MATAVTLGYPPHGSYISLILQIGKVWYSVDWLVLRTHSKKYNAQNKLRLIWELIVSPAAKNFTIFRCAFDGGKTSSWV